MPICRSTLRPTRFALVLPTVRVVLSALVVLVFATLPAFAAEPVDSGGWTRKGYAIEGEWKIVSEGDDYFLELDEDFATRKAPDLKLFLSATPLGELTDDNATDGSILVAPLERNRGAQRYLLPAGIDLGNHRTLVLHCEKFSKLWGGATIGIDD